MSSKSNYSYVGIAFTILVFGIIFIPKIVDRIKNGDIVRSDRMSNVPDNNFSNMDKLMYLEIDGEAKKVPDFSFTNQHGDTITNKDYLGNVYIVEFFFTTCPTICPIMSRNLVDIQERFKGIDGLGIASFTINPSHDTPEVLKAYAEKYGITNPNWNLMTGDKDDIYQLANLGFNLYAAENENIAGGFEHSGNFALIDKNGFIRSRSDQFGNPRIYYRGTITEKEKYNEDGEEEEISMLKEDIKKLLNE
ncbi:electron transport protein [Formosa agariphila KMM 3901]|uniref:Electron transport protein n=1 Tax=Formosa agariphila (strain DSM 15362 / KCTC 12365 / LMG 23005 / KMM 3901 / M-2Alg 35-1) TaxID=1347342 RepID=T2KHR9_FORAG|nr:SCO family protein [Formosa agariphila]CDF77958.1 electron transport protein [Formosa agariphila KMM 3901]